MSIQWLLFLWPGNVEAHNGVIEIGILEGYNNKLSKKGWKFSKKKLESRINRRGWIRRPVIGVTED
jgi:hypothetical protein